MKGQIRVCCQYITSIFSYIALIANIIICNCIAIYRKLSLNLNTFNEVLLLSGTIKFIDFEVAMFSNEHYELACHFCEYAGNKNICGNLFIDVCEGWENKQELCLTMMCSICTVLMMFHSF